MTDPENHDSRCASCRKALNGRTDFTCECCGERACKSCQEFLPEGTFSFLSTVPETLRHSRYCRVCHEREVLPALDAYNESMEKARGLNFIFKGHGRAIPVLRRAQEAIRIEDCADRDETILRMAFRAVELGFNAVIEGVVTSEKVRNEGYQTSRWKGSCVPVELDVERFERRSRDDD